jgi:uncharacterized membrane protein
MDMDAGYSHTIFLLRWFHVLAGITWIGLLYFFNFVNVPFQGVLEKEFKPKVNPPLLTRALWWFRWSAMVTFVVGWVLLFYKYSYGNLWFDISGNLSDRAIWILFGGILGSIMWFNVWFVIWPAQKQIIGFLKAGQTPPEMPAIAKRALTFSRVNAYLSGPMLFGMIAPNNYGAATPLAFVIVMVVGMGTVWFLIKTSFKVGQSV